MKIKIRQGVFETNSSSTHSLVICTADEYAAFKNGDLMLDAYSEKLIPLDQNAIKEDRYQFKTYDNWDSGDWVEDTFFRRIKTAHGDEIVCFGAFGRDG